MKALAREKDELNDRDGNVTSERQVGSNWG